MKKTAVEWLRDLYENRPAYEECILEDEWEEALKMEKEQIEDAFEESRLTHPMIGFKHETFEDYYNETFNTTTKNEQTQTK
jgi:hypothetical protein